MKKILALWAIPRSTSTAFETMMRERGDFFVSHEPFALSFYYSEDRCNTTRCPDIVPNAKYNFSSTWEKLQQKNEKQRVFIKDMGYQVIPIANEDFLSCFENTFLIRHPAKTLPSLFEIWPDFTLEETGYVELNRLFEIVNKMSGKISILIDSDDLVQKPEATIKAYCNAVGIPFIQEALKWKSKIKPEISQLEGGWHNYLQSTSGFQARKEKQYVKIEDNQKLKDAYDFCLPYYQKLYENRLVIN
ncbi:MAG: sulfotransferase family protein [Sphaerospermopsis sp. SIO1G1]|nr:sulfotransferase family protein [Sphaerospermopsis sp. SIO1G1]